MRYGPLVLTYLTVTYGLTVELAFYYRMPGKAAFNTAAMVA
jgi:hypothetical protein